MCGASDETRDAGCGHTHPEYLPCSPSRRCRGPQVSSLAGRKTCPTHVNTFCECLPQNKQMEGQPRQYAERNRCTPNPGPRESGSTSCHAPRPRPPAANPRECGNQKFQGWPTRLTSQADGAFMDFRFSASRLRTDMRTTPANIDQAITCCAAIGSK